VNDEELQHRLRRIDPTTGASIDPVHGPRAAALMEQIMNTPTPTNTHDAHTAVRPGRRWPKLVLGGAAAVALIGGAALFAVTGDDGDDGDSSASSVELSLGAFDPMSSCLPVADQVPLPGTVAFKGTVIAVGDGSVTLAVAEWYGSGDADEVVLSLADVASPALDGVEFVDGAEYLVAATDGVVQTCGMSGRAGPELAALYAGWFAG
jgi:hypothetical protein